MTSPVIELTNVCKSFPSPHGPISVLRDVSLRVAPGDFVVITGPSGSGKSTLLSIAGLLDTPTAGTVTFDGESVPAHDEATLRRLRSLRIGMIFQRFHLLEHRTVLENVTFRYRYLPHDPEDVRARARTLLERFGLASLADRPARVLSAGEMQRVAIARAVVLPPRLLLADEPTGSLDPASSARVMDCFRDLHAQGISILLVTHNLALRDFATRHLVCAGGGLEKSQVTGPKSQVAA